MEQHETPAPDFEPLDEVVNPENTVSEPGELDAELPEPLGFGAAEPGLPAFVYALGRVEPRFPSLAVEKEFAQASGRGDHEGLTDRQTLQAVISERNNRYLARQLCWVFSIEGLETYLLTPHDPADLDLLIEAVREEPRRDDLDIVMSAARSPPRSCATGSASLSLPSTSSTRSTATR